MCYSKYIYIVLIVLLFQPVLADVSTTTRDDGMQVRISVSDADQKIPIEMAHVVMRKNKSLAAQDATNPAGLIRFRDIDPGRYIITVWFVGYTTYTDTIQVDRDHSTFSILLHSVGTVEQEVEVIGEQDIAISHIDPRSGNQVFESETYHVPPTSRMTDLIQENLLGAVRAPTGEVHIRGQHGEFTYYIDGLSVPLGVFGGLNEIVDPKVIDRATFITGGFPAEYGGQMAAIVDLNNRVPTGKFHLDASSYAGSYLVTNNAHGNSGDTLGSRVGAFRDLNSNGQSLSMSDHVGSLGFFISGSRQETDRRIDQPTPVLFHDHGFDYFLYGKFDYVLSDVDYLTSNINFGRTSTQVPYDSLEGIASDMQMTTNGFQTLSYFRTLNSEIDRESNFFIGAFAREGGLQYSPGSIDPPNFHFFGDTTQSYLLSEDRSFTTIGFRSTFDKRFSHMFMYKVGITMSSTSGTENFISHNSSGVPGPSIKTPFNGSDAGIFAESDWHPLEWTSFELGLRYDQHIAPDVPLQRQISPRIRWNFFIDANTSAYLYYGRLFMPTNVEGLRSISLNVSSSLTPTLPERDNFYEAMFTHTFPFGLSGKISTFFKKGSPGIDDETVGNSAIKTPVNIETVRTTGLELGLSYTNPEYPLSAYINSSIIHAYGTGLVTGGFLDISDDGTATDLDHDQRLSIVTGINYQPRDWYVNLTGIYGSGLTNGNPNGVPYKTGLFDFNVQQHTTPGSIFNIACGYTFRLAGGSTLEPELFITNILDHAYELKGVYASGASYQERRNVILKLSCHI